jgi:transcriptional antiterminator NusG
MIEVDLNTELFRIPAGRVAEVVIVLSNRGEKKEKVTFKINSELHMKENNLEWSFDIIGVEKEEVKLLVTTEENTQLEYEVQVQPNRRKEIYVNITAPKAAEIGDYGIFKFEVLSSEGSWSKEVRVNIEAAIVAVKTTIGQEVKVARDIGMKAKIHGWKEIFSVLAPYNLKGYVFVETSRPDKVLSLIRGIKDAKGIVRGEMHLEEIKHYLTPTPTIHRISVGDIVELVEGPFKGEHAKVMQIDEAKNEITVELFEAMVPIPITVKAEAVRLLEKEGE